MNNRVQVFEKKVCVSKDMPRMHFPLLRFESHPSVHESMRDTIGTLVALFLLGFILGNRFQPHIQTAYTERERVGLILRSKMADFERASAEHELVVARTSEMEGVLQKMQSKWIPTVQAGDLTRLPRTLSVEEERYTRDFPCKQTTKPLPSSAHKLPVYVFVAGIEGSGHHAMETVWFDLEHYYPISVSTFNPGLHSFAKEKDVDKAYQFAHISGDVYKEAITKFVRKAATQGKTLIIDSRDSYPMGGQVGSQAHPDLLYLAAMDGTVIDLRVLVMYRDPASSALSSVRRFQSFCPYKNHQWQGRSAQESLSMIHNSLPSLPCGKIMRLSYEDFIDSPSDFVPNLAQLLSVESSILGMCISKIRSSTTHAAESVEWIEYRAALQTFFSNQKVLWPLLLEDGTPFPPINITRPILERLLVPNFEEPTKKPSVSRLPNVLSR